MGDWVFLFATYRVVVVRDDEIVQGVLLPDLHPDHPAVRTVLDAWEGTHWAQPGAFGTELTLVRRLTPPPPERWWLHALLFLLTALTTTAAGARFMGREPFPLGAFAVGPMGLPFPVAFSPADLVHGLAFSLPLMGVLFGHEMGHYVLARWHRMDVSPPYFIPSPRFNVIGTFGAFIRLRSPIINRAMLLDVGAAGPIASFVLSIPVLAVGLALSEPVVYPGQQPPTGFAVSLGGQLIFVGGSALVHAMAWGFGGVGNVLILHPLAFAGWLGLFVTALNLFPLSQLDGGHVLYALFRSWQPRIGLGFLVLLLALGQLWMGWWFWAALILLLGRGSIRHPAVLDPEFRVQGVRRGLGWACILIFVLTFVAVPFRV
ncbi:MAG: site-2 protease family protein [Gemmatimonadetes bacterium]|nr:site-2 protease family protein [Gemmatimonadota bacterium]